MFTLRTHNQKKTTKQSIHQNGKEAERTKDRKENKALFINKQKTLTLTAIMTIKKTMTATTISALPSQQQSITAFSFSSFFPVFHLLSKRTKKRTHN